MNYLICYGKRIRTSVPTAVSLGLPGPLEDTIEKFCHTEYSLEYVAHFRSRV